MKIYFVFIIVILCLLNGCIHQRESKKIVNHILEKSLSQDYSLEANDQDLIERELSSVFETYFSEKEMKLIAQLLILKKIDEQELKSEQIGNIIKTLKSKSFQNDFDKAIDRIFGEVNERSFIDN